jgi:hypothetical protein
LVPKKRHRHVETEEELSYSSGIVAILWVMPGLPRNGPSSTTNCRPVVSISSFEPEVVENGFRGAPRHNHVADRGHAYVYDAWTSSLGKFPGRKGRECRSRKGYRWGFCIVALKRRRPLWQELVLSRPPVACRSKVMPTFTTSSRRRSKELNGDYSHRCSWELKPFCVHDLAWW